MAELTSIAGELYGNMVKAVADTRNGMIAIDAELHSDLEQLLLENGSNQEDLWGFNIRPRQNNRSRYVESGEIREKITGIVNKFIGR